MRRKNALIRAMQLCCPHLVEVRCKRDYKKLSDDALLKEAITFLELAAGRIECMTDTFECIWKLTYGWRKVDHEHP